QIERVARGAKEIVVAGAAKAHGGAVRLAQDDGASLLDALGEGAVPMRGVVLERAHAAAGGGPAWLEVEQVLDGRGDAVQRPQLAARHHGGLGPLRGLTRVLEAEVDEGVEAGIAGLDPRDERVHHLQRRQLPPPDARRQLERRDVGEFLRERQRSLLPLAAPAPPCRLRCRSGTSRRPSCAAQAAGPRCAWTSPAGCPNPRGCPPWGS